MNTRNNISYSNPTINFVGTENVCLVNHKKQTPKTTNLNGQLWKQYDESGKIESVAFDFKGNLLSKKQQVISSTVLKTALDNYETYLVDWTGLPNILDTTIFETSSEFDALNRVTKITLPENVNSERKEITPSYNRAGALERVSYDGTEYVKNIGYNAKGQRLLIAFGNDIMTRYCYHKITFRLLRQRSEKYVKTKDGNKFIYTPQSGTNKQDDGFNFDLVGNILKILHRVNDCGINGSLLGNDALDRNFDYDPLYRVVSADGRESDTQNQNDYLYTDAPAPGSPNANNVRAYKREYAFDKLGNVQQVKQLGTNGFTRNFSYNAGHNTLQKVETPTPTLIEDFTYDACGNQLTAGTTRNYVWNAGNQLITYYNQVGSADPTIFTQYDYSGMNRVSKLVKTGTTYERTIYIDGIFEYSILENGTTYEKNYVHVMDDQSRIAMVRVGTPFPDDIADSVTYNLENQIGSSVARLDTNGTVIDREEFYPFGDSSLRTFTKKRYRYVGKEKDLESGLYYYGARYYLAWTCRFISVDPLAGDYTFYTPYNYAGNKPINKIDIDGMQEENAQTAPTDTTNQAQGKVGGSNSSVINGAQGEGLNNENELTPFDNIIPSLPDSLYPTVEDQQKGKWTHPTTGEKYTYDNSDNAWGILLPEVTVHANQKSESNSAKDRVDAAKKVINQYKQNDTKYEKSKLREFGTKAKLADCSSTVTTILREAGQGHLLKGTTTATMQTEIKSRETNNSFRKKDPLAGDIMMWGSHVTLVTEVNNGWVYFAHMGNSGPAIGKAKLDANNSLQSENTWGSGGFIGFWTPSQ